MNNVRIEEARSLIRFYMRQMDGGYYPLKIGNQSKLLTLVDQETAQKLYEEEITRVEARIGPVPRWDSDKKAPVPGTPKP